MQSWQRARSATALLSVVGWAALIVAAAMGVQWLFEQSLNPLAIVLVLVAAACLATAAVLRLRQRAEHTYMVEGVGYVHRDVVDAVQKELCRGAPAPA